MQLQVLFIQRTLLHILDSMSISSNPLWQKLEIYSSPCEAGLCFWAVQDRRWLIPNAVARKLLVFPLWRFGGGWGADLTFMELVEERQVPLISTFLASHPNMTRKLEHKWGTGIEHWSIGELMELVEGGKEGFPSFNICGASSTLHPLKMTQVEFQP